MRNLKSSIAALNASEKQDFSPACSRIRNDRKGEAGFESLPACVFGWFTSHCFWLVYLPLAGTGKDDRIRKFTSLCFWMVYQPLAGLTVIGWTEKIVRSITKGKNYSLFVISLSAVAKAGRNVFYPSVITEPPYCHFEELATRNLEYATAAISTAKKQDSK